MVKEIQHGNGDATATGVPLADRMFTTLLNRIHQGELPPGAIVNEAALADEFKVSRGPVREAVRRLQGIQLVTREPYSRARVVSLTAEGVRELFEMRLALEGMACRLAAERMTDAEIQALIADLERERQQTLDRPAGVHAPAVFDFHERIVRGCRNARIAAPLCDDVYHLLRMYRRRSGAVPERKELAYAEHWQIMRAIRARDGELAESLMRAHVGRAADHLLSQLPAASAPSAVA
jgi:DNA-binding GntR family transcriptional regulator